MAACSEPSVSHDDCYCLRLRGDFPRLAGGSVTAPLRPVTRPGRGQSPAALVADAPDQRQPSSPPDRESEGRLNRQLDRSPIAQRPGASLGAVTSVRATLLRAQFPFRPGGLSRLSRPGAPPLAWRSPARPATDSLARELGACAAPPPPGPWASSAVWAGPSAAVRAARVTSAGFSIPIIPSTAVVLSQS